MRLAANELTSTRQRTTIDSNGTNSSLLIEPRTNICQRTPSPACWLPQHSALDPLLPTASDLGLAQVPRTIKAALLHQMAASLTGRNLPSACPLGSLAQHAHQPAAVGRAAAIPAPLPYHLRMGLASFRAAPAVAKALRRRDHRCKCNISSTTRREGAESRVHHLPRLAREPVMGTHSIHRKSS